MEKKKQERAIVHLEKDGQHYYYGNLKALTDHWDKDAIGVSYTYLRTSTSPRISPIETIIAASVAA